MFCFASLDGARERSRFPPLPRLRRGIGERAKIHFPQTPFLFARLLETRERFFGRRRDLKFDGERGCNYLNNNTTKQIPKAKYKIPNIRGIHNSTWEKG